MRQLTAGFLALTALLGLTAPVQAQETVSPPLTPSCTAALANAQKRIEAGGEIEVRAYRTDISTSYADYPQNRPFQYTFAFRETARGAVMSSPKFVLSVATDVIHACDTVSMVIIGVDGSGNFATLGLMPGGQVEMFHCLEAPRGSNVQLIWGQTFCV